MGTVFKACAACIISAVLCLLIKKSNPENAHLLALGTTVFVLTLAFSSIAGLYEYAKSAAESAGISDEIIMPCVKCVAVSIVTKLCADTVRDAGESSTAEALEILGASGAMVLSLPLMRSVLTYMENLMQ